MLFCSQKFGIENFWYTIYIFDSDLFLYAKNLSNKHLKPVLSTKLTFEFVNLQRLLYSQKAGVKCSY